MKTIEQRLDFLEETTIKQNDNIIKTNDHILDLLNNDSEIWNKINENDKWYVDQLYALSRLVMKLAEKSTKQNERIAELERIIKENNV
jgi:hypothetical protein